MEEKYVSLSAEMFHFETWVNLIDPKILKEKMEEILTISEFTIVNYIEHFFLVEGFTCVWVLAESHLAIHTFPKSNKSYIQISSCNKFKLETFKKSLNDFN